MIDAQHELDTLADLLIDWWMNHHDDTLLFNQIVRNSPTIRQRMKKAVAEEKSKQHS
jgi:hypothetical protein